MAASPAHEDLVYADFLACDEGREADGRPVRTFRNEFRQFFGKFGVVDQPVFLLQPHPNSLTSAPALPELIATLHSSAFRRVL